MAVVSVTLQNGKICLLNIRINLLYSAKPLSLILNQYFNMTLLITHTISNL